MNRELSLTSKNDALLRSNKYEQIHKSLSSSVLKLFNKDEAETE